MNDGKLVTQEMKAPFAGFRDDLLEVVRIPETFFTEILPRMDNLQQLRLVLYLFWHLEQQEDEIRLFRFENLKLDPALLEMIDGEKGLKDALNGLINIGVLLKIAPESQEQPLYFINGPQGRAAVDAIQNGRWQGLKTETQAIHLSREQSNIFNLYEENIGVITPMMAEILKEDETAYPPSWIKEAIEIAVTRNARNWKYVQAVLERWQKEGRGNEQNRRDNSQDPESYRESWLGHE